MNFDFDEAAFDEWLDSLGALVSDAIGNGTGEKPIGGGPLPVKGVEEAMGRVMRLDSAVEIVHLFFAYCMHRAIAAEFVNVTQGLHDALNQWAGKKALGIITRTGIAKAFGTALNIVITLSRTADKITIMRNIARRIRFHGRASRMDLLDALLFNAGKRSSRIVHSRHSKGNPPRSKDGRSTHQRNRRK